MKVPGAAERYAQAVKQDDALIDLRIAVARCLDAGISPTQIVQYGLSQLTDAVRSRTAGAK